jgi:hypothetical protein
MRVFILSAHPVQTPALALGLNGGIMEFQAMFNFVGGAVLVAVGWWCKEIWDSVKALKEDIKQIEIDLPKNYVSKADIENRFDKIDATLERLFDRLDLKADK